MVAHGRSCRGRSRWLLGDFGRLGSREQGKHPNYPPDRQLAPVLNLENAVRGVGDRGWYHRACVDLDSWCFASNFCILARGPCAAAQRQRWGRFGHVRRKRRCNSCGFNSRRKKPQSHHSGCSSHLRLHYFDTGSIARLIRLLEAIASGQPMLATLRTLVE